MACSAHLLSHSLYSSSHRSSAAAARNLRFRDRQPALASPGERPSSRVRGRRGLGLRVAASFEQGRRHVEVTYDPQAKFNQLADQIDKNAGMTRLNLFSPCKINVFLRITGKRSDGFHDLASLFHVISLGDTIKFSLSPSKSKDRLSTNVPGVPVDESNLIIKALNLYRKKTGTDKFFGYILIRRSRLVLVSVVEAVMLQLHCGLQTSLVAALLQKRTFKSGLVKSDQISPFSFHEEHHIVLVEERMKVIQLITFLQLSSSYVSTFTDFLFIQIVQDIPNPLPENLPMVLIKPPEACSTTEVYKRFR